MRHLNNMSLKNNNISNPHQKHIFLDVNGAIETFFSTYKTNEEEFKHASYNDDTNLGDYLSKQLVSYLLKNKNYLEDFIEVDDETGEISKLFPDNCIPEEVMEYLSNDYYPNTADLVCE